MRRPRAACKAGARWLSGAWLFLNLLSGPALAAEAGRIGPQVFVESDQVSILVQQVSRQQVLNQLAQQGNLRLMSPAQLSGTINLDLRQVSMAEALRQLLPDFGFVLRLGNVNKQRPKTPSELWIFGNGEPTGPRPHGNLVSSERSANGYQSLVALALDHPNPAQRVSAVTDLAQYEAVSALETALTDVNAAVREAAVEALFDIGDERVHQALILALDDVDSGVRQEAREALADLGMASGQ